MREEERSPVEVTIMGQRFCLRSDQSSEYITKLASYVESHMVKVANKTRSVSTLNIAILAAMNIADEYLLLKEQQKAELKGLAEKTKSLISFIDEKIK